MTPLGREIAARIARDGPMPVDVYMELCLAHPLHGYYRRGDPLGSAGDFTTAPEISQMFGELLGLWAAQLWADQGRPGRVALAELGPGRGTLMADARRAIRRAAPDFAAAAELHLVEISPTLRAAQADRLAGAGVTWHDSAATLPDLPLIVLANEFFDALPVRQYVRVADGWRERRVTWDEAGGRFAFLPGPAATLADLPDAPPGTIRERRPSAEALMRTLAARVVGRGGGLLAVDYGAAASGTGDTLQAVRRHRPGDPLAEPGANDLSAQVDFQALADAARAAGAVAHGPLPQGRLLHRLGIAARAAMLLRAASPAQAREIGAATRRLIDAGEMGTLFLALAVTAPGHPPPPGFDPPPAPPP